MKLGCNFIQLLAPFQASVPSIVEKEGIDLVKERKSMMMIMASFITTSWAFQGLFAEWCPVIKFFFNMGGFHLHILVFPYVYQFNSRIGVLVHSSFAVQKDLATFQHHFKICLMWFLHVKDCSFYTHLFYCTEVRRLFISSTAI